MHGTICPQFCPKFDVIYLACSLLEIMQHPIVQQLGVRHGSIQSVHRTLPPRGRGILAGGIPRYLQAGSVCLCQRRRAHAGGHRRGGAARYPPQPAHVAHFFQQGHQGLPGIQGFLRHGGDHRADRVLLPPRRAGAGRAQADSLSAGAGGWRQVVAGGKAQAPDGKNAVLRRQRLAGERFAPVIVFCRRGWRHSGTGIRHSPPLSGQGTVTVGGQAPARIQRRHHQVSRDQALAFGAGSDGHFQDRAGRRE